MFTEKQFTLTINPMVSITFLKDFVDQGGFVTTVCYLENLDIWKSKPHKILVNGNCIYNDKCYSVVSMLIPFLALKDGGEGLRQIIKNMAKYNKTIVFYEHGTFQTVYDFGNIQENI